MKESNDEKQFKRKTYNISSFYGYGGPISSTCDEAIIANFEESFLEYCRNNSITSEFIRFHPLLGNHKMFNKNIQIEFNRKTVYLNLESCIEDIRKKEISSKCRNMITKANRNELTIRILELDKIIDFVNMYKSNMQRLSAKGFYYFSDGYFMGLREMLAENGFLIGVFLKDRLISVGVFLKYGDYFHYHLAASDKDYLKYAPNNLLLDYAISLAKSNHCKVIHFGGGRTIDQKDSLLKFKQSFSTHNASFYVGFRNHSQIIKIKGSS